MPRPPRSVTSRAAASTPSERPVTYTVAPDSPRTRAMPRPTPRLDPVTTATLPARAGADQPALPPRALVSLGGAAGRVVERNQVAAGALRQRVLVDQLPELGRVLGDLEVGELVDDDVVEHPVRQHAGALRDPDHARQVAAGPPAALLAVAERDRAPAQAAAEVAGVEPSGAVLEPGVGGLGAPQLALDARPHPFRPFGALALGHPVRD